MFDMRKTQEQVLADRVASVSDEKTAERIVFGENRVAEQQTDEAWVNSAMKRLEDTFSSEQVKEIRMNCQCGYGMEEKVDLVKALVSQSSNMEELASLKEAKAAGLLYIDGTLHLQFMFCACPMLNKVDKLNTKTWCQCTTGYSKVLFEKAFGCSVEVELLKSIKAGDDTCLMKIIPEKDIWN